MSHSTENNGFFADLFQQGRDSAADHDAERRLTLRAQATALKALAECECPEDVRLWGERHGIPTFAAMTWRAGFIEGFRLAHRVNAEGEEL